MGAVISLLGSEVGRGHPFYLDGLHAALRALGREELVARRSDVFALSRGASRLAWRSVRAAYRLAGRGGAVEIVYRRLRGRVDYDADGPLLRLLGRDLRRWAGGDGIVVVDHPALVGALGGRPDVWYLHGEHAAPAEAMARRAARVFVPSEETAEAFARGGVPRARLRVTGLCVEPALVPGAAEHARARRGRLASDAPLTIAFFSSGAEPGAHVRALVEGAAAVCERHRAWVFARHGGRLERLVCRLPAQRLARIELVGFETREELDRETAQRFDAIDLVVSPPHERSHWALGLGVPFLLVGPDVGPFAPGNRALLLREGVALEIASGAEAAALAERLAAAGAREQLAAMAQRGTGRPIEGFAAAARELARAAGARS